MTIGHAPPTSVPPGSVTEPVVAGGPYGLVRHGALSVIASVVPGQTPALREVLRELELADVEENPDIPFRDIRTAHFARFVVVPGIAPQGDLLAFESNYDAPLDAHLEELVRVGQRGLQRIFGLCEGWPSSPSPDRIVRFLKEHRVPNAAFYIGTRGRSLGQIRDEAALRERIEELLDLHRASPVFQNGPALQIRDQIRQFLAAEGRWERLLASGRTMPGNYFGLALGLLVVAVVLVVMLLLRAGVSLPTQGIVVLVVVGGFLLLLRLHETEDRIAPSVPVPELVTALAAKEDKIVQNQLTHCVDVKPSVFRWVTLKLVLGAINVLARIKFNQGELGGIPSIHFARWLFIDGRRLLFFSNFDGSWENYLGDFVDKAHVGLTGVWSNTTNFPRARFLINEGATDEQAFKQWARAQQLPTDFWYSAYKFMTVQNINNNTRIREGLAGTLTSTEAEAWLRRL